MDKGQALRQQLPVGLDGKDGYDLPAGHEALQSLGCAEAKKDHGQVGVIAQEFVIARIKRRERLPLRRRVSRGFPGHHRGTLMGKPGLPAEGRRLLLRNAGVEQHDHLLSPACSQPFHDRSRDARLRGFCRTGEDRRSKRCPEEEQAAERQRKNCLGKGQPYSPR